MGYIAVRQVDPQFRAQQQRGVGWIPIVTALISAAAPIAQNMLSKKQSGPSAAELAAMERERQAREAAARNRNIALAVGGVAVLSVGAVAAKVLLSGGRGK